MLSGTRMGEARPERRKVGTAAVLWKNGQGGKEVRKRSEITGPSREAGPTSRVGYSFFRSRSYLAWNDQTPCDPRP